jgi:hypothetical protein
LQKEGLFRKEVADTEDMFIVTIVEIGGLSAPIEFFTPPSITSIICTIELLTKTIF